MKKGLLMKKLLCDDNDIVWVIVLFIVVDFWVCWVLLVVNVGIVCFFVWFFWLLGILYFLIGMNWKRFKLMLNFFIWGLILFEVCIVSFMFIVWGVFFNF